MPEIFLADDEPLVATMIRSMTPPGVSLRTAANVLSARAVIPLLSDLRLALIDLSMPGPLWKSEAGVLPAGFHLISEVAERFPRAVIVAFSAFHTTTTVKEASAHGALALLKVADSRALRLLLLHAANPFAGGRDLDALREEHRLTGREMDVLVCYARGAARSEVAESLSISEATVKSHVQAILRKTDSLTMRELLQVVRGC